MRFAGIGAGVRHEDRLLHTVAADRDLTVHIVAACADGLFCALKDGSTAALDLMHNLLQLPE